MSNFDLVFGVHVGGVLGVSWDCLYEQASNEMLDDDFFCFSAMETLIQGNQSNPHV